MKHTGLIILLLLGVAGTRLSAQSKTAGQGNIISISDVHFNPFFDSTLVNKLIVSNYGQWAGIFRSSAIQKPNGYGSDSNFPLLVSALAAMRRQNPSPDFMVITGDFLCHNFQKNFARYGKAYPDSLRSFSTKTIRFMAMMLNQYFPQTTILPVLGNNDSFCGDYMIDPDGEFLNNFARAFAPLQRNHNAHADARFIATFSKGGYYTFSLRDGSGGKMVMLNTVFFSNKYSNACGGLKGNPAGVELNWLAGVLKQSQAAKSKLWLACHIPPGIDAYASSKNATGNCLQDIKTMWRDSCSAVYLGLVTRYAPIIHAGFAGHTHMDDFRLLYQNGKPISFMHITPAVSPLFANNPGFQVITYSKATFSLLNAKTYYLNLNSTAPAWAFEYDYQKAYGVKNISPASLNAVRQKIATDTAYRNKYINFYDVGNGPGNGVNLQNWKAYWCTTGNLTTATFADCYCGVAAQ
jgi:sphingomyelin phosphodiesterase acid-like 3